MDEFAKTVDSDGGVLVRQPDAGNGDLQSRSYGDSMDMTEFVQWMGTTYGTLTARSALQQAAFMLCCDVISQDIAKAPLQLRERLENGTSKVVMPERHQVAGLLATEPNTWHTWYEFTEMLVLWHCLTKNAHAPVMRDGKGDVLELIPVQTNHVMRRVDVATRTIFYDAMASTLEEQAQLGGSFRTFSQRDMVHVKGRMFNGVEGYSTLEAGRTTLETGASIEQFRDDLFSEDGQTRGVFRKKTPEPLDEQSFQRLRQQLGVLMSRMREGKLPVVLEGDMEFQPIASKPDEMELTKQFQAQILATCRLLRVPPHKVFEMEGIKYENLETSEKMYVGDTLVPIAIQFEQNFGKRLLVGKDRLRFFFQYDREAMVLQDTKATTDRVIRAAERGLIEHDEGRARLGFNPLPNGQGQVRTIPVNMNVVDRDGTVVIGGQATKPASEKPEGDEPADKEEASPEKGAPTLRIVS